MTLRSLVQVFTTRLRSNLVGLKYKRPITRPFALNLLPYYSIPFINSLEITPSEPTNSNMYMPEAKLPVDT